MNFFCRHNFVELEDSIFGVGQKTYDSFVDIETEKEFSKQIANATYYYSIWFYYGDTQKVHQREVYTILDLLGDLGGIQGSLELVIKVIVSSLSEH